jgi:hypothetical protein
VIDLIKRVLWPSRARADAIEQEKIARLEQAEKQVASLTDRGNKAVQFLTERSDRNHWGESIKEMIQGVL